MRRMCNLLKEKYMDILIWGVVSIMTCLYISLIFNYNVWTDEAFTFDLLRGNIIEILQGTAKDVHPPLYYLYAKIFDYIFGYSIQIQKIAAIIPMTALLVFGATVVRKHFGDRVSLFFILFITCVPCSMEFAVQIRMYTLALLFVTMCGVYAYFAYEDGKTKNYILFALNGVLAAYTHYFAFGAVIAITGLLLLSLLFGKRKQLKKWFLMGLIMIVLYLPWLIVLLKQIDNINGRYWIPEISKRTVWQYFIWTFDSSIYPGIVYGFLVVLFVAGGCLVWRLYKKEKIAMYGLALMLVPTAVAFCGVVVSKYILDSTIYRDQYIFPALGLLALSFAIGISKINKVLLIEIGIFLALVGGIQYKECFYQEYQKTLYPQTKAFFEENLAEEDIIIYNYELFGFIYKYHFPEEQLVYLGDCDFGNIKGNIWFINTVFEEQIDKTILDEYGLHMEYVGNYGIEHNEFEIYKIY